MAERTCVVTGSASGIGRATAERLRAAGHRVIGVDLAGADVEVDLATAEGRSQLVDAVADRCGGALDAVVANAGISREDPLTVRVNFFGAVATLEGLRPLLAQGSSPRAVATSSMSILHGPDADIVAACLAGDEDAAVAAAERAAVDRGFAIYPATKLALARWVRRAAPTPEWAGAGIALNAVAPGVVRTPMTAEMVSDPGLTELLAAAVPMPLGGHAEADDVAAVVAWLAGPDPTRVTGQVLFVDGGADAVLRGDDVW